MAGSVRTISKRPSADPAEHNHAERTRRFRAAATRFARRLVVVAVWALLLLQSGCSGGSNDEAEAPPALRIVAVNYPLQYFADRLKFEDVVVEMPVPADQDPAEWQPDAQALEKFRSADLILLNGADYASWPKEASLAEQKTVVTADGFRTQWITADPKDKTAKLGLTWLDPELALRQADAVKRAMARIDPANEDPIVETYERLESDLRALDERLTKLTAGHENQPVLAAQPVYAYLGRRCKWNLRSLNWDPQTPPSPSQWDALAKLREKHPAKWMLWPGRPPQTTREKLATLGIRCVVFVTCAQKSDEGDYLTVMRANLERLRPMYGDFAAADAVGSRQQAKGAEKKPAEKKPGPEGARGSQ